MMNFSFQPAYDEKTKAEILNALVPKPGSNLPKHIQKVSTELMNQISLGVGEWRLLNHEHINTGSQYRDRGNELNKLAKKLREKITRSNQQMQTALYFHCSDILKMNSGMNDISPKKGDLLKWMVQVIQLLELGSAKMSEESSVTQGRDLRREKDLIFILGHKWNIVTGKQPGSTRNTQFHRLVTKVFEVEGLVSPIVEDRVCPSEKLLKSGLKEFYTPKP